MAAFKGVIKSNGRHEAFNRGGRFARFVKRDTARVMRARSTRECWIVAATFNAGEGFYEPRITRRVTEGYAD